MMPRDAAKINQQRTIPCHLTGRAGPQAEYTHPYLDDIAYVSTSSGRRVADQNTACGGQCANVYN